MTKVIPRRRRCNSARLLITASLLSCLGAFSSIPDLTKSVHSNIRSFPRASGTTVSANSSLNQTNKSHHNKAPRELQHQLKNRRKDEIRSRGGANTDSRSRVRQPAGPKLNAAHAMHESRSEDELKAALSKRGIVVSGLTGGGLGNQQLAIIQNIETIRKFRFSYILPLGWTRPGDKRIPSDRVWDVHHFTESLKGEVPVGLQLPDACNQTKGGRWDIHFTKIHKPPQSWTKPFHVVKESLRGGGPVKVLVAPNRILEIDNFRQFILETLRRKPDYLQKEDIVNKRGTVCVLLSPQLTKPKWESGHILQPSKFHREIARRNWQVRNLAVVHLRYEESNAHGCKTGPPNGMNPYQVVCVARIFPFGGKSRVMWIPADEYARKMGAFLRVRGVSKVYLTRPKYMSVITWKNLAVSLSRVGVQVAENAAKLGLDEDEMAFVERAIAFESKVFMAEAGSTWSTTLMSARIESWKASYFSSDIFDPDGIERRKGDNKRYRR